MYHNDKGIPINCQSLISIVLKYSMQMKIEDSHLKDHDMASSTFTVCLYLKRLIVYDFFLKIHRFWSNNGVTMSLRPPYLKKIVS